MTVTDHIHSVPTRTAGVRVCDHCGRPTAARDKSEYTVDRARVVVDRGLCVCPSGPPARGPSLI